MFLREINELEFGTEDVSSGMIQWTPLTSCLMTDDWDEGQMIESNQSMPQISCKQIVPIVLCKSKVYYTV